MALEGVEGRMFRPMAITVALALGGALLFSLTAFPALAAVRAARARSTRTTSTAGCSGGCAARYGARSSSASLARPALALGVAAALRWSRRSSPARTLGAEFVPRLDEGELSLDIKRLPSVSITEAQRLGVAGRGGAGALPRGAVGRDAHRPRRGGDRSGRPRRDRGDGQAAPQGGVDDRARPRRAGRGDQGGDRARGAGDLRRRCRSRSRIASTSCWRARAPTW